MPIETPSVDPRASVVDTQQTTAPVDNDDSVVIEHEQHIPGSSSTATHGNAPFACNVCKRNYTRVDHLARHYRSRKSFFPTFLIPLIMFYCTKIGPCPLISLQPDDRPFQIHEKNRSPAKFAASIFLERKF